MIVSAFRKMAANMRSKLEYRYIVNLWREGDENFAPNPGPNLMQEVTLPASLGKNRKSISQDYLNKDE